MIDYIFCDYIGHQVAVQLTMSGAICEYGSTCEKCNGFRTCRYADSILEEEEDDE